MKKPHLRHFIFFFVFQLFLFFFHLSGQENALLLKESKNSTVFLLEEKFLIPSREIIIPKIFPAVITAYSSDYEQTDETPFITAANTPTRDGVVANNFLPFGTKVRFPEIFGDKVFIVEDRMHPRKDNFHFDVWFEDQTKAVNFGVKESYVEILE